MAADEIIQQQRRRRGAMWRQRVQPQGLRRPAPAAGPCGVGAATVVAVPGGDPIAEFVATLLFLYVTVAIVIGHKRQSELDACGWDGAGVLGIAWALGGMIFLLVYCTAPPASLVLAPPPIGFAVFVVHLATIPVTGTGINPARSFGAAIVYNQTRAWHDQWIFWVGPLIGAAIAPLYHEHALRASALKALVGSFNFKAAGYIGEGVLGSRDDQSCQERRARIRGRCARADKAS